MQVAATRGAAAPSRAAVLGHPIVHSQSPRLHAAAYRALELDIGYTAEDVSGEDLAAFMGGVRADRSWAGLSVTMPLKAAMAGCVDDLSTTAAQLGVVNTVTFAQTDDETGGRRLTGHNTDVDGIVDALRYAGALPAALPHVPAAGVPAAGVILGGGGTARAALAALARLSATDVPVYLRDPAKAASLTELGEHLGVRVRLCPFGEAAAALATADLVISTLPPHGADQLAAELIEGAGSSRTGTAGVPVLLDVAYDPWPSALARCWRDRGGVIVPGLEMLLYQAVQQVRLFTGAHLAAGSRSEGAVINAMCDAVGLPRRRDRPGPVAG